MKRVKCPCCGAAMRRNGRTTAGAQRWRCESCGASRTVSYDDSAGTARRVSGVAALKGEAGGHAWPGAHVQEARGRILADLAHAGTRGRGSSGTLPRRHLARPEPRRADSLRRQVRGLVVHGRVGNLKGLGGTHGAHPGTGRGGVRWRNRVRFGGPPDMAAHESPEVPVPCVFAGEEVHDHEGKALGLQRALRAFHRAHASGHPSAGRLVGRALSSVVRVLGRLPRGCLLHRRETRIHTREVKKGPLITLETRLAGDALHLP